MRTPLRGRPLFAWLAALLALTVSAGCVGPEPVGTDDEPLSDLDAILADAPADRGMSLPVDGKADEALPVQFDLMEYQTPVRSQGRRGTCTVFATTALMESLYVREGTLMNPDFSEQFLQWSVKTEVNAFQETAGSNPSYNLQAINRFGIVEESLWPYENSQWGTTNDPACTGDAQPTRCFTNGEPPADALAGTRFTLPRGRWINPSPRSVMGHLVSTRTPVVVSGDFFYQAWNHGRSSLPTSDEYKRNGWILAPNAADIEDSGGDRRAGHGYLLVGFDQELEVQERDAEGNGVVDAEGQPVVQRGFFLFKNSWGTGAFGSENPHGSGYGWISFDYVQRHLTAYAAGIPEVMVPEVCNDGNDNDRNGATDCADAACAMDRACVDPVSDLANTAVVPVPDNSPTGAGSTIEVTEAGTISSLAVTVDVTHSYRGDLTLYLVRGAERVVLVDQQGGSADDVSETFTVEDFNGTDAIGLYELLVVDNAAQDTGSLQSWSLDITRCTTDCAGTATTRTYSDDVASPIPDVNTLERTIDVTDTGEITSMSVQVDVSHTFMPDLTIRFRQEGGREFVLLTEEWTEATSLVRTFDVPGFVGSDIGGAWTLSVIDGASGDTGTLNAWSIQAATR